MTQVWMVRYDGGLYLFENLNAVEISIRDMYDTSFFVEKEIMSDQAIVYQIMKNGRVQDRIAAGLFDVHEHPTVIHRDRQSEPYDYDRPPQKPATHQPAEDLPYVNKPKREEF